MCEAIVAEVQGQHPKRLMETLLCVCWKCPFFLCSDIWDGWAPLGLPTMRPLCLISTEFFLNKIFPEEWLQNLSWRVEQFPEVCQHYLSRIPRGVKGLSLSWLNNSQKSNRIIPLCEFNYSPRSNRMICFRTMGFFSGRSQAIKY